MNATQDTLALLKGIYAQDPRNTDLKKAITTSYGLVAIDLQAPAKNLYPTITPLRNKIPRVKGRGGLSTQWRQITAINNSNFAAQAFIPEGQRAAAMSYATSNKAATYVSIGADDYITFEAVEAAENFEDLRASMTMRLLQRAMINEELALLGGNASLALGTGMTAATLSAPVTAGSTLTATNYYVKYVLLTLEGFLNSSVAGGVATTATITGLDGLTYNYNGGSSGPSLEAGPQAVSSGQGLLMTAPYVAGTCAYAWYVGTSSGAETLQAITTNNRLLITAPISTTNQAITAVTADNSKNANLAFDGLLNVALNTGNLAYVNTMASNTTLTATSKGSVAEIDTMFKTMWDTFRVSPTVLYVNSQQQQDITTKVLNAASGPLLRYNTNGNEPYAIVANGVVEYYYNPFDVAGGTKVPVKIHPNLPPGTILAYCENLPAYYQNNEVPQVCEVHTRRDYYEQEYPIRTRRYEHGVYASEVLAVYATFGMGVINNITPG